MRCNHCNKTIPEVSINCPFCKEIVDPNAKPVVNFGELGVTDYDSRFDIKANNYEEVKEEKKKNPFIIWGIIGGIAVLLIGIVAVLMLNTTPSGYTYFKNVNDQVFTFLIDNYTGSYSAKSGTYNLYLKMNEHEYEFNGDYALDTKNRIVKVDAELNDPRQQTGQIIIGNNVLKMDAYLENNYFYLLSEQIYERDTYLMFPIDDETGLLTTKKYDLESLINGVYDAVDAALSKMTYNYEEGVEIVHNGEVKKVNRYYITLDNAGKKTFLTTFFQILIDDGSFVGDYAKIQGISSSEAETILNNYLTSADFRYSGNSDKVTTISIYFDKAQVYRLEADMNEKKDRLIQIDIGKTKYYLEYFEGDKNIYSGSLRFTSEEKEEIIIKEYEITFDSDKYVNDILLTLEQNKSSKVKKKEIESFKSIQQFEDSDYDRVKSKLSGFFHNVNWVDDLENIFKEKCTPDLTCECQVNAKYCNCNYNNTIIVCPVDSVTKKETKPITTTTVSGDKTTTTTTVTTTTSTTSTSVITTTN